MTKPFSVDEDQIKHYVMPEVTGNIVGYEKDSVRPQTVEDIEALQKEAYEEGRKQGKKAGLAEMQEKAQQLEKMFNYFARPLTTLDEDVEKQLTELALSVARAVIKKECCVDASSIQSVVHQALEFLPVNARNICVRLNPVDINLLKQADVNVDAQDWKCISDNTVSQGGCFIESDTSVIDASLETRVQQIVDQLTEHAPRYEDDE